MPNGVLTEREAIQEIYKTVNELKETAIVSKNNIEHIQGNITSIKSDMEEIKSINNNVQIRIGAMETSLECKVGNAEFVAEKTESQNLKNDFVDHKNTSSRNVQFTINNAIVLFIGIAGIVASILMAIFK